MTRDRVRFNVGGRIFETTSTTLANAGRDTMLGALLDENWNPRPVDSGEHFIDRNPDCFAVLLELLRTGELNVPPSISERQLYREAVFYGLVDHVHSAKSGPLDGNRLRLVRSVPGIAPQCGKVIRAGPDGGCCVINERIVHVYDSMLDELGQVTLDYEPANDVAYLDAYSMVVAGDGMGLFSTTTGELRHRFPVVHASQPRRYSATTLESCSGRILASCTGGLFESGIGAWDTTTGQQTDFFYESTYRGFSDACRLQWLPAANCLLVATLYPRTAKGCMRLLDLREKRDVFIKREVWSWSDAGTSIPDVDRVLDAVAMEETSGPSVCVVNKFDQLAFIDLRGGNGGSGKAGRLRWSPRPALALQRTLDDKTRCPPKLAVNNGRLFSSMNDSILVFSGPKWVLTARLQCGHAESGPIRDFSIGGDRLFALHNERNLFDVWENPMPTVFKQ